MSIKKFYFLIALLLPVVALANNHKPLTACRVGDGVEVKQLTSNSKLEKNNDKILSIKKQKGVVSSQMLQKNPAKVQAKSMAKAPEVESYPVNIEVKGLEKGNLYIDVYYFNANSCDNIWDIEMEGNIITCMVPEGENDIVLSVSDLLILDDTGDYPMWVNRGDKIYIIEGVQVGPESPMLTADLSECRPIPLELCFGDGTPVEFPTKKWDGEDFVDVSDGNALGGSIVRLFYNSKYDFRTPVQNLSPMPFEVEGYDSPAVGFWETKVNKASDNWVFAACATYMDYDYNMTTASWLVTPGTEKVTLSKADFTPVAYDFAEYPDAPVKGLGLDTEYNINSPEWAKSRMGQSWDVAPGHMVDMYLSNKDFRVNNTTADWNLISSYMPATKVEIDEEWGDIYLFGVQSPKYIMNKELAEYMPATERFATKPYKGNQDWQMYDEANWGVPQFNYDNAELGMKFNASAPYVVTYFGFEGDRESGDVLTYYPESAIYGLAGEDRNQLDWRDQKFTVTFNGEPVNEPNSSIYDFIYDWNPSEQGEGILKFDVLVEPDLTIDGVQAKNIRTMTLHQGAEDWASPTLTCLQLRDCDDKVTTKFDKASDGHIIFSASDIHPGAFWEYWEDWDWWAMCTWSEVTYGADVKVEVSPCGKDAWQEIEATATTESSPALGDFYDVALSQLTTGSDNGWFDLRITVTDKAGNSQEQTITPAFYVNNLVSGIAGIESDKPAVVKAIYDINGIQLKGLQPGVNIVVYTDGSRSKVLMK